MRGTRVFITLRRPETNRTDWLASPRIGEERLLAYFNIRSRRTRT